MKNKQIQAAAADLAVRAKEANDYVLERLNNAPNSDDMPPEQKERVLDAISYLEAWRARFSAIQDIAESRSFAVYQEGKELIIVRPDNEQTAHLITKAEELGAHLTKLYTGANNNAAGG